MKRRYKKCNCHDFENSSSQQNLKNIYLLFQSASCWYTFAALFHFTGPLVTSESSRVFSVDYTIHNGLQIFNAFDMAIHSVCNYIFYVIAIEKYFVFRPSSDTETFLNNNGGNDGGNNNNNIDQNCLLRSQPITEICDAKQ